MTAPRHLTFSGGEMSYRRYTLTEGRFGLTDRWSFEHEDYDGAGPDYRDHRHGFETSLRRALDRIDELEEEYKPACSCGQDFAGGDCSPDCDLEQWRMAEREAEGLDATPSELRGATAQRALDQTERLDVNARGGR